MAKNPNHLAGFEPENTGGLLAGFLADEEELDRRSLWRLGSWGVAAVSTVIIALLANQSSIGLRRDQVAAADLARQTQQIQSVARDGQAEARRLASAIDTLNGDRDRLYSRVTVLEQGLDSVTGTLGRQSVASAAPQAAPATPAAASTETPPPAQTPSPPPIMSPVATTPTKPAEKPAMSVAAVEPSQATGSSTGQGAPASPPSPPPAPPDSTAPKLVESEKPASAIVAAPMPEVVAAVVPATSAEADALPTLPKLAVQRTEFGVDVGGANSIGGLRALWRGLLKSRANAPLASLQPIIVVKETSTGLGMQLRLVAGPLSDAAVAAKICATMVENNRPCETTVFDGQRLAMKAEEPPASAKPPVRKRSASRGPTSEEPPKEPEPTTLSSFFGGTRAAK
jgi:hypothetical protein